MKGLTMPPRARKRKPEPVIDDQLDDLDDTVEETQLEIVPDLDDSAADETSDSNTEDVESEPVIDETEQMLDLIHRELGVILDAAGLEMCLTVSDFYRSARRVVEFDQSSNDSDDELNFDDESTDDPLDDDDELTDNTDDEFDDL
jgi:hypothetical protein